MQKENEELKEENKRLKEDLNGLPSGTVSGENIDITDSAEMRCELNIRGNSKQDGEPTPNVPVEVESCGDNVNIFDGEIEDGGYDHSTGVKTFYSNTKRNMNSIPVKSNMTYYLSYNGLGLPTNLLEYNATKEFIKVSTISGAFTTSNDAKYINFYRASTGFDNIKLEENSIATPRSPYGQGCINEVICNENLYNEEYYDGKGYNSNTGILEINANLFCNKDYVYILKNGKRKVTLSKDGISKNTRFFFYDINKKYISTAVGEKNVDIPQNAMYLNFQISKDTVNNDMSNIKIEQNENATAHIKHQSQTYTIPTQQPFRAIGNIRDTFIKKNNKWYERHFIHRVVFNGTENWSYNVGEKIVYRQIDNNTQYGKNDNILFMSNYLKESTFNNHSKLDDIVFAWSSQPYVCIKATSKISGAETAKSWIKGLYDSGNPLMIDRVLITPTDIECTEEQNKILNKIENEAKTYKNITHVYSIDKVSSNAEITYKKDLETLLTSKESEV